MIDPLSLYSLDAAVAESMAGRRPVLLNLLDGFVDAGQVGRTITSTILENCEHEVLATFDHDQLHDYRSRRPTIVFDSNRFTELTEVHVLLHKVTDSHGEVFLLLEGPEPDMRWELMLAAIEDLVDTFSVRLVISAQGIPMAVPHTRPIALTEHGTDPERLTSTHNWIDRVEMPASFAAVLEYRLGRRDRSAHGFAAHVPHYLTQASYTPAVIQVMSAINQLSGLTLPTEALDEALTATVEEIERETADSEEVQRVVQGLEEQYDAWTQRGGPALPSADEIGAEFERFLAEQDKNDPPESGM
ncbi:PAC2 family protein [Propionibacteriaceae bacterium Y1685]|uniref:PAC2 family protein n=1 Tax=Microlunatus sp. Y1700 TaxID=3418487 RepID=UPI003B772BD1